jgi:hypothetical protein
MTRVSIGLRSLILLAALQAACNSTPAGECTYKGKQVAPETQLVDGCLICSCGVPGSKSQGLLCVPLMGCVDGGTDGSDDGG